MKQLTEPFGFGNGDTISLTSASRVIDAERLTEVLLGYSCYPPAIPKIVECLRASGRYDCTLQSSWFRKQHSEVRRDLLALGIEMEIVNIAEGRGKWHPPL